MSETDTPTLTVRLAANTLVQVVGAGVASAISFVTFVAITRGLGPEAFGDFTAAGAFLFLPVVLADVGLSSAVLREISADPERTEPAMRASLPLRALISAAAILAAVGVGLALPFTDQTKTAILISSVGAFLTLMTLALLPVLQAHLKMQWAVGATVAGRLATLGLTLGALGVGLGFKSVVAAQSIGLAVTFLLTLLAVAAQVRLTPVLDTRYWRALFSRSLVLGLAIALSLIYFRVDAVLLALLRSPEEVGLYGAAYKFIELAVLVPGAAATSVFPPLARFVAAKDPRAQPLVQKAVDVLLATSVPLTVLMLAFPEEIIVLTAGEEFEDAAIALRLLAPYLIFAFVNTVLWRVLIATERDRALLGVSGAVLAFNVIANLIFIPLYGYKAAAVVSVISEALITIPIALAVRREGFLPNLRYAPALLVAVAAMSAVILLPGPAILRAVAASVVYAAVLLVMPGTAKDVVRELTPAVGRLLVRGR